MSQATVPNNGFWSTLVAIINNNFTKLFSRGHFAQVAITYPVTPALIAVTGTGDTTLKPSDGGFVSVLNHFLSHLVKGTTCSVEADGRIKLHLAGLYRVSAYFDISHSANGSTVGVVVSKERNSTVTLSDRSIHAKLPNNVDIGNITGIVSFAAEIDDIIGVAVASDISGNINIITSIIVIEYLGEDV